MDALQVELTRMTNSSSLAHAEEDVDAILGQLIRARESIAKEPSSASITLTKLQNPTKQGFDRVTEDLKKVYQAHNKYGKALNEHFPVKNLATDRDVLASHPALLDRAIAMHFLREGQFTVASTFLEESHAQTSHLALRPSTDTDLTSLKSQQLQERFSNMYEILHSLKAKDLLPAIQWARDNSDELHIRGSNLEFELTKLQYIWLFLGQETNEMPDSESNGLPAAHNYARVNFPRFQGRFSRDIQQLAAAMAYQSNLSASPYRHLFSTSTAWETIANSFTREFCSLLGLSAESPLYIACTAGAIALPTLQKLAGIVKEKHTEWTTQDELPVEILLPKRMLYHAIFVCPVSKEQGTEANPPMMMPCGHVVAKESLGRLSKGTRYKCPYCPGESGPKDAKQIWL